MTSGYVVRRLKGARHDCSVLYCLCSLLSTISLKRQCSIFHASSAWTRLPPVACLLIYNLSFLGFQYHFCKLGLNNPIEALRSKLRKGTFTANLQSSMGDLQHRMIRTNGINMHIAEQGSGPVVLLLHGFPSLWYMWRHQMQALAEAGFRAVAPDQRGYGQTDVPDAVEEYTYFHLVGDIVGLLDALGEQQVFVVGHDWGAVVGYQFCLLRPDRVKAYVSLGIAYTPRESDKAAARTFQSRKELYEEGFYMMRFQEPGRAERDFANFGTSGTVKAFLSGFWDVKKGKTVAPKGEELSSVFVKDLAPWLTEEDLKYYTQNFEKTGFTGALNWYRNIERNWKLTAPWANCPVMTKTYLIIAEDDAVLYFPGNLDRMKGPALKQTVPNLKQVDTIKGAHFMPEENPQIVNSKLIAFFNEENQAV